MPILFDLVSYDVAFYLRQGALYDEPEYLRLAEALLALRGEPLVELELSYEENEALSSLEQRWHEDRHWQCVSGIRDHWPHHTPLLPLHYAALQHESAQRRITRSWHATLPLSLARLGWLERMLAEARAGSLWDDWAEERYGRLLERLLARARAQLLPTAARASLRVAELASVADVELEA